MTQEEHDDLLRRQEPNLTGEKFEVPGAGWIEISKDPHNHTVDRAGFGFGVSWGRHGYVGGVLGRMEAIRLAEYILEKCADLPLTERQEVELFDKRMRGE
jgi:hypothetical protein